MSKTIEIATNDLDAVIAVLKNIRESEGNLKVNFWGVTIYCGPHNEKMIEIVLRDD